MQPELAGVVSSWITSIWSSGVDVLPHHLLCCPLSTLGFVQHALTAATVSCKPRVPRDLVSLAHYHSPTHAHTRLPLATCLSPTYAHFYPPSGRVSQRFSCAEPSGPTLDLEQRLTDASEAICCSLASSILLQAQGIDDTLRRNTRAFQSLKGDTCTVAEALQGTCVGNEPPV